MHAPLGDVPHYASDEALAIFLLSVKLFLQPL